MWCTTRFLRWKRSHLQWWHMFPHLFSGIAFRLSLHPSFFSSSPLCKRDRYFVHQIIQSLENRSRGDVAQPGCRAVRFRYTWSGIHLSWISDMSSASGVLAPSIVYVRKIIIQSHSYKMLTSRRSIWSFTTFSYPMIMRFCPRLGVGRRLKPFSCKLTEDCNIFHSTSNPYDHWHFDCVRLGKDHGDLELEAQIADFTSGINPRIENTTNPYPMRNTVGL